MLSGLNGIREAAAEKCEQARNAAQMAWHGSGMAHGVKQYEAGNMGLMELAPAAAAFVVVGIVIATGLSVMSNYQTDLTVNSSEYNATGKAITGIGKLADQLPTIGLALAAAAVIGIIFGVFAYVQYNRSQ